MFFGQYKTAFILIFLFLPLWLFGQDSTFVADTIAVADTAAVADSISSGQNPASDEASDLPKFNKQNWTAFETEDERIEFYKKWKTADSAKTEEKYRLKPEQRAVLSKIYKDLKFGEKIKYHWANQKIKRKQKKHFRTEKRKFKKTIRWSRPEGSRQGLKNMEKEQKIRYLKAENLWKSRKEAYRRARVKKRFNRKEQRLRKRYALSQNEKTILNKGMGMSLEPGEKRIYRKAKKKQVIFTKKLLKLRKRRQFKIQDRATRKRIRRQKRGRD